MEWHIMNVDGLNSLSSNLGMMEDGVYVPSCNSQAILEECVEFLTTDSSEKTYRRLLFNNRFPEKELLPLIMYIKDDHTNLQEALRLMILLTNPVEYDSEISERTKPSWTTELENSIKQTVDKSFCKAFLLPVLGEVKLLLEESGPYSLTEDTVLAINNCIFMIRNLLYMVDFNPDNPTVIQHIERVKLLLDCGFEEVLISLLQKKEMSKWTNGIMQTSWLIYKGKINMLFSNLIEKTHWKPMLECTPVECGRISDLDTNGFSDIFSNTCNILDGNDQSRQLHDLDLFLPSHESNNLLNITAAMSLWTSKGVPEFRNQLTLFTTRILEGGFMAVIANILEKLKSKDIVLDEAYLFWELALFMKFAKTRNLPVKAVKQVLTEDMLGYLTYQCFIRAEDIFVYRNSQKKEPQKLHLALSALKEILEFLFKVQGDDSENQDEEEKQHISLLNKKLAAIADLPQLMVYMIRHCSVELFGMVFLEDLVFTNHILMLHLENWMKNGLCNRSFSMLSHVKHYATFGVMEKYGMILEHFLNNSPELNNCILTMMHHVAGDCGCPNVLLQKSIIDTFLEINDRELYVSDEVDDLIEFIISKFITMAEDDPYQCAVNMFTRTAGGDSVTHDPDVTSSKENETTEMEWTSEDSDILIMVYMETEDKTKIVDDIFHHFQEIGMAKSREQIVCQLVDSEWMEEEEKVQILSAYPDYKLERSTTPVAINQPDFTSCGKKRKYDEEKDLIMSCIRSVQESGCSDAISWLKGHLCEAAFAKINPDFLTMEAVEEPITKFHVLRNKSIPIVCFTEKQDSYLSDEIFCTLLENLGIQMPEDVVHQHPRIPHFWSPKHLLNIAEKLGPLEEDSLKFNKEFISKLQDDEYNLTEADKFILRKSPKRSDKDSCSFKFMPKVNGLIWTDLIQNFNKT
ncbi:protein timeless-like [Pecten maximus]|uniref:protein timeless-like n=1 Tax=Pecten maximus TaxID=6579 RepID=UPI0014589232|nr:protein timeless-like [Pecten maximus]